MALGRGKSVVAIGLLAGGCTHDGPSLPTYPAMSDDDAIRLMADRARSVRTVSGEGLLTLTRPDGESVRLDAAVVMRPPGMVRLRAWKFGQAVFDLTMNESGVYLISPEGSSRAEQIKSAGVSAARLAKTWSLLSGGFFDDPAAAAVTTHGDSIDVRRKVDGQDVLCEVDRPTLTVRRYSLIDPAGHGRFTLTLDRYAMINGMPWARRMTAVSDAGRIVVAMSTVEVNGEIGPDAFKPPRRAEKLP